ncbi:hypothetical protein F4561_001944 [Lipingzhangella halophila]|uniref:Cytochrome P450 n=1 Tax=Lipingzhangella halophila TaxID=1783352 RepID=A0A7W7W2T8_9ACTN|nr:cytochrome P450 [Lipingzhangella halophila]MBB4931124.1 hypothetical protein [Lipingzhangella halophila]
MDTPANDTVIDLADPAFLAAPDAGYDRARELGSVVRARFVDGTPVWLVTQHEAVRTVLGDRRFANASTSVPGIDRNFRADLMAKLGVPEEYVVYLTETLLDLDPPDHTRLRKLVTRAFTARRIAELRPRVAEISAGLLAALPDRAEDGAVDLVEHYAYPLPITVISELVGVPDEDRPLWKGWSDRLVQVEDPGAMAGAAREMVEHIKAMIAERRSRPSDDLLDALVRVRDEDDDRLTETELITMVLILVIAGYITTAHLIGNGALALLTHPDQLAVLRDDPAQVPAAVHELMRWCGPVMAARPRFATEDVELDGVRIATGDMVMPALTSANHDPHHFAAPERLDITRRPPKPGEEHVGFGQGAHYCLGAALARQEGEVAFGQLFDRYPHAALAVPADELEWKPLPNIRHLLRLPLRL